MVLFKIAFIILNPKLGDSHRAKLGEKNGYQQAALLLEHYWGAGAGSAVFLALARLAAFGGERLPIIHLKIPPASPLGAGFLSSGNKTLCSAHTSRNRAQRFGREAIFDSQD